ncbi:MAG: DUF2975 domain-containing protein [Oscillospiraceae bacterium]|nr:DUF2975 domain-containing protein [Oscillospiraceae bacterium]
MNKLCKTARGLDVFFRVLFWLAVAMGAVMLIADIAVLAGAGLNGGEGLQWLVTLDVNGTAYSMADAAADGLPGVFITLSVLFVLSLTFGLCVIHVIRQLLRPMKEGRPFESAVCRSLRRLGWLAVAYGVLEAVVAAIAQLVLTQALNVTDAALDVGYDLSWLLLAVLLFLFSYIFRYGEELQRQADETL